MPYGLITRLLGFPAFRLIDIETEERSVVLTLEREKMTFRRTLAEKRAFLAMTTGSKRFDTFCGGRIRRLFASPANVSPVPRAEWSRKRWHSCRSGVLTSPAH
jgi:hypothetical protein